MIVMLVLVISVAAAAAAQVASGNNNDHQPLLRHDESTRFDGVAAPTEGEDRELLGQLKLDIFSPRKGGGGGSSKSSKGGSSKKSSSKSSSKKKPKKKKRHQRRKKKKKSDTKSKSKKSGDDDDDDDKLVKLSIKGSYSSSESKKKSDTKSKLTKKKSSGGSKHDDKDKSDKKKSSPSKSTNNKNKKKSSLSKTDVDPSKRLCNTSKERQCRDDCFKSNKCQKGHVLSPCHKKCRYKCCDPDSKYESTKKGTNAGELCNTSEEKLCRVKCFEKKGCGENDEDCQMDCRQDCCSISKDDKSKSKDDKDSDSSDDDDRHSKKDDGKDADDDDDDDGDNDKSKSFKPLKWDGDDIPSECQEDVDKFNSCYEKQYEDGKECYGYNAARELEEIFEAVTNSDDRKRDYETCGDWYDFVCPIRAETDCCRNRIRAIGRCLGREVFDVGGDDCDDTCRGYGDDDKEAVGNVFDPDTFSTLVGLLTDYDLVGVLSGDDPITVS